MKSKFYSSIQWYICLSTQTHPRNSPQKAKKQVGGDAKGCILKYAFAPPVGHPPSLFFLTLRSTSINTIAKPFDNLNGRLGTLESATIHQTVGFTDTAKFGFKGWARSVKPERRSSHLLLLPLLTSLASLLSKAKNGKRGFFWIYLLISDLWRKKGQKKAWGKYFVKIAIFKKRKVDGSSKIRRHHGGPNPET